MITEDKRTTLAVFLCIVVVMLYTELVVTPNARHAQQVRLAELQKQAVHENKPSLTSGAQDASQTTNKNATPPKIVDAAVAGTALSSVIPTSEQISGGGSVVLEGALRRIEFSNLGARILRYELMNYPENLNSGVPLNMIRVANEAPLPLGVYFADGSDALVRYELIEASGVEKIDSSTFRVNGATEAILKFKGGLSDGGYVTKDITALPNSYLLKVSVARFKANGEIFESPTPAWLEWSSFIPNIDHGNSYNHEMITALLSSEKLERIEPVKIKDSRIGSVPPLDGIWIGVGDKYFGAVIIPEQQEKSVRYGRNGSTLSVQGKGAAAGGSFTVYSGAKEYSQLEQSGFELQRFIDLGLFSFLAYPLLWAIKFLYSILGNYGLAIIALTLILKSAFLPLTKASFKSMKAMQEVAPEMKALQERIKDRNQLNQEIMALYKRRGVNPMGGCLPMLIQIPVFLGLYNALLNSIYMRHSPFALWIHDLSVPEYLPVAGIHVPVMVILMGLSMFWQTYTTPSTGDPMQRKVMLFMPIVFTGMFIVYPFPAGLVLYWLVNNIISIVQQVAIRSESGITPGKATVLASVIVFAFGYLLTLV